MYLFFLEEGGLQPHTYFWMTTLPPGRVVGIFEWKNEVILW